MVVVVGGGKQNTNIMYKCVCNVMYNAQNENFNYSDVVPTMEFLWLIFCHTIRL